MNDDLGVMIVWIRTCIVIAAFCTTSFPVLYAFSRWYESWTGRALMLQAVAFALAIDVTAFYLFWPPELMTRVWMNLFIFSFIALATSLLTVQLWIKNYQRRKDKGMEEDYQPEHADGKTHPLLSNRMYDNLKRTVALGMPSLITLYTALATVWGWDDQGKVVATMAAVNVFLGALLQLSGKAYAKSDEQYDGSLDVSQVGDMKTVAVGFDTHPDELDNKDKVVLKVNRV